MRNRSGSEAHRDAVARRIAELARQIEASGAEPSVEHATSPGPVVPVDVPVGVSADVPVAVGDEWWGGYTRVAPQRSLSLVPTHERPRAPVPASPDRDRPLAPPTEPALVPATRAPVPIPIPGRHAARRPRALLAALRDGLVPETLRGRIRIGSGPVAVVAVLVAVLLAITCWRVVRADPRPVGAVAAPTVGGSSLAALSPATEGQEGAGATPPPVPTSTSTSTVTVDVAGKVRRPGIVVLKPGARVVDAVRRAGGARPGVDLTAINLARPLVDGEQIVVGLDGVPAPIAPAAPGGVAPPSSSGVPAALVDLNLASQAELEELPEVGPVTAAAIIAWRDEHGRFTAVEELLEVDGIGEATLAKLAPLVTV